LIKYYNFEINKNMKISTFTLLCLFGVINNVDAIDLNKLKEAKSTISLAQKKLHDDDAVKRDGNGEIDATPEEQKKLDDKENQEKKDKEEEKNPV
jgi:hypothetical protein